jgi:hypothetical protein
MLAHRLILFLAVVIGLKQNPSAFVDSELIRAAVVLILCDCGFAVWSWWTSERTKNKSQAPAPMTGGA